MNRQDDELNVRPGRLGADRSGAKRSKSFVGEVMRAAKKAGHTGRAFARTGGGKGRSSFGRGRRAAFSISYRSTSRRVVVMARVVRHRGGKVRSAPLARHIAYLKREGVTRDGADARIFGATSEDVDAEAFASRCAEDRHHFRFTVSPEDAAQMADLRTFTRELMQDAERDLGTGLDWAAVDHWNTDNPHVHVLIRGKADDGEDMVISRDYISRGLRGRAAERVTLELGPRSEQEIRTALQAEVNAERWTSLDRRLRDLADIGGGVVDLRPGDPNEHSELRRLLLGRAAKLERLGLSEQVGPAQWNLKPRLEGSLRELAIRGDIIKTMHQAMAAETHDPDTSSFALHGKDVSDPILGRLVERGLQDELTGSAYAIIEGVDGRTHHVTFSDLELTGDARPGAIVETRSYAGADGRQRTSLSTRSDWTIETQVSAQGATWIDRQLLNGGTELSNAGFAAEVRAAMDRRIETLTDQGLAWREGERVVLIGGLINTLRRRELDQTASRLAAETGLVHQVPAEGDHVAGTYRQRLVLSSGRFAMIDDGLGFQLVPWRPALDRHIGREVSGVMAREGRVEWTFDRKRGLGI